MSVGRLILTGSIKSLAVRGASLIVMFGLHVLLARAMPVGEYGKYNFALTVIGLLSIVVTLGLDKAAIRFIPDTESRSEHSALWAFVDWSTKRIIIAVVTASALVGGTILLWIPPDHMFASLWVGLLLLPGLALVLFLQQVMRGLKLIIASQIFEQLLIPAGLSLVAVVYLLRHETLASNSVLIGHAVLAALSTTILWVILRNRRRGSDQLVPAVVPPSSAWLSVAIPLGVAGLMSFLLARGEIIMLGLVLSPEDVGQYSVALRVSNLMIFGLAAANAIGGPVFSELFHRQQQVQLQQAVARSAQIALAVSIPLFLAFILAPGLILSLFGTEYTAAESVLIVLAVGALVNVLAGPVGPLLAVTGQQNFYLFVVGVIAVTKLAIVIPAATHFGILGVAIASTITTVMWNVWLAVGAYRRLGIIPLAVPLLSNSRNT